MALPQIAASLRVYTRLRGDIYSHATQHGLADDPDHEVGDLQDCLSEALSLLTTDQLKTLRITLKERDLIGKGE